MKKNYPELKRYFVKLDTRQGPGHQDVFFFIASYTVVSTVANHTAVCRVLASYYFIVAGSTV